MNDKREFLNKSVNIRISEKDHEALRVISNEVASEKTGTFSIATLIRTFIKKGISEYEEGNKDLF